MIPAGELCEHVPDYIVDDMEPKVQEFIWAAVGHADAAKE